MYRTASNIKKTKKTSQLHEILLINFLQFSISSNQLVIFPTTLILVTSEQSKNVSIYM